MKANKRDRIVKVRLTNLEYEELTKASKSSKCMSDYFRPVSYTHLDVYKRQHWRETGKVFDTVLFRVLPGMDDKRTLL